MRTRWTKEQIDDFRTWHEELIQRLYDSDKELQKKLRKDREKFLGGIASRREQ